MEFLRRAAAHPSHIAVLPGTFNPITIAHMELARAVLPIVDEVVFVLPRALPHKDFGRATFDERMGMLKLALEGEPRFSLATAEGGLFIEIARECRAAYEAELRVSFLCGRDAAERIVNWDYGRPGAVAEFLAESNLLVAARKGEYLAPAEFRHAINQVMLGGHFDEVSATEVRDRIARCEPWEHLVPEAIRQEAGRIYRGTAG